MCGGGNNGGDGRVAAGYLEQAGREVRVVDAKAGETDLGSPEVLVDALFGTGFSGEPRPDAARLIETMNVSGAEIVAVDVPSGVDASTGEVAGVAVEAECSVVFHGEKVGLHVTPGAFRTRSVALVDIGLEPRETADRAGDAGRALRRPAALPARQQVHGRISARRRRLAAG